MNFICENFLLFMPQFIIVILGISMIMALILIRVKNGNFNLMQYFSNNVRRSYSKRTTVDLMFSVLEMIWKILCFLLLVSLIAIFIFTFSGKKTIEYVNNLYDVIPDEMLGWVTLMITLAAILVAFKKDYYLVFSIEEVLERHKFKTKILTIVNIMLFSRIKIIIEPLLMIELYKFVFNFIYLVLYIITLILGCYLIYIVMYLLYSKEQSELDLLDKLYYKLRNRIFYFDNSSSNIAGIILNGEYLYDQYVRYYEKVKKYDICKVKFESVHNECNDLAYKKVKNIISIRGSVFLGVMYSIYLIKVIVLYNIKENYQYVNDIKCITISIITWGLCIIYLNYLGRSKPTKNFKKLMNRMFLSDYVYTYEDESGKKYLTSTAGLGTDKINSKYFISILNLTVYLKMIIKSSETEDVYNFVQHIEKISNEPKYSEYHKDEIFYIINIYYEFLKYVSYKTDRDEIIKRIKTKQWTKIINKRRIQSLMKAIIYNTQNLYSDDGIKAWSEFTDRIKGR